MTNRCLNASRFNKVISPGIREQKFDDVLGDYKEVFMKLVEQNEALIMLQII